MSKIIIEANTSYVAESATIALLKGGFVAKEAIIRYNVNHGLPDVKRYDDYPLILEGFLAGYSTNVHVYSVTAGYGGTGPNTLVKILKFAGFKFEEDDILTDRLADYGYGQINLTLVKKDWIALPWIFNYPGEFTLFYIIQFSFPIISSNTFKISSVK